MDGDKMTRNGRKMCITIVTTRLGDSDFSICDLYVHCGVVNMLEILKAASHAHYFKPM